jgi:thiamine biosynthesis lipoprotein
MRFFPRFFFFFVAAALLGGCRPAQKSSARTELVMGTVCRIDLYGAAGADQLCEKLFDRLRELEKIFSSSDPGSELSLVNARAQEAPVAVSPELSGCVKCALYFAEKSGGAFDPAVGPLVKLWDIGGENPRVPSQAEIAGILPLVNWRAVELTEDGGAALFFRERGMALDLGAVAKGWAADELARMIQDAGIPSALLDLGGNIYVWGSRQGKSSGTKNAAPWRVAVQNPLGRRGDYIGYLEVPGGVSVVTSGVYERFFEEGGRRYHHILDTATGYPVENGLLSVTVVAASSARADALSTACFALGSEQGAALADAENAAALFVAADKTVRVCGTIAGKPAEFFLTDESFALNY